MKDNKAYSYKVVFYGETVALNDILGEDKLNALNAGTAYNTDLQSKYQLGQLISGKSIDEAKSNATAFMDKNAAKTTIG